MTDTKETTEAEPAATPPTEPVATPPTTDSAATESATKAPATAPPTTAPAAPPGNPFDTIRARVGVVVVVALMGVGVYWSRVGHLPFRARPTTWHNADRPPVTRRPGPRDTAARPIRPEEMALFEPLAVGSALGPATVTGFTGMRDGYLSINVRLGNTPLTIYVTRVASNEAGRYSLYFMGRSTPTIEATLTALRQVLATHNDVPIPPDLHPFEGW